MKLLNACCVLELSTFGQVVGLRADGFYALFLKSEQCISFWPEDGRPYVALGKLYSKQSRYDKARAVYERGCQATQGENPYIWQVCT
jgi:uncharacterized protein HemY